LIGFCCFTAVGMVPGYAAKIKLLAIKYSAQGQLNPQLCKLLVFFAVQLKTG